MRKIIKLVIMIYISIIMFIICKTANISKCTNTDTSSNFISYYTYNYTFSAVTYHRFINILIGSNSGHEYYFARNGANSRVHATRRDTSFNKIWEKSYNNGPRSNSFIINNQETQLYFLIIDLNYISIIELSAATGVNTKVMKQTSLTTSNDYSRLFVTSDDQYIFFTAINSSGKSSVCKANVPLNKVICSYNFDANANDVPLELALFSDSDLFLSMNAINGATQSGLKLRMNFDTNSIVWIKKFASTTASDNQDISNCLYSSSKGIIYSLTEFKVSTKTILFIMNSTDGNTLSIYSINIASTQSSGMILINTILYFSVLSASSSYLIVFDTSSKSTKCYTFDSSLEIFKIGATKDMSKIIFLGHYNNPAFRSSVSLELLDYDSLLSINSLAMVDGNSLCAVTTQTSPTLQYTTEYAFSSDTYLDGTLTLTLVSSDITDISYNCGLISKISLPQNETTNIPIDLSCSISGSTNINYSLIASSTSSIPTWISFDTENRNLIANTTNISYGTTINFIIKSTSSSPICDKIINLKVIDCNVTNCHTCEANSSTSCKVCVNGYNISQDSSTVNKICVKETTSTSNSTTSSTATSKASVVTQSVVGAAAGASMIFSFCNLSTPQGLWITMNQFQLILLLLLTNSHIPKSIVDYLSGLKATTCSMNFIPFKDIPGIKWVIDSLDHDLENKSLDYFGIFSGSTFANNLSLICVILIILVLHLLYLLIFKSLKGKFKHKEKCVKLLDWFYQLFTFTIYLRFILEANQFMMLSSFSEIKSWSTSDDSKIISLCIAFILSFLCIGLVVLTFLYWIKNRNLENTNRFMSFKAFFSGLKDESRPRLYSTVLLARRAFLVIFLVMGSSLNSILIIAPMIVIQFTYLSLFVVVRPYKATKDNILEITNELFYFVLIALLSHFNSESKWTNIIESCYLFLIIGNSLVVISIMITAIIIQLCHRLIIKCRGNSIEPKSTTNHMREQSFKTFEPETPEFTSNNNSIKPEAKPSLSIINSDMQMDGVRNYYSKQKEETKELNRNYALYSENARYWMNYNNVN